MLETMLFSLLERLGITPEMSQEAFATAQNGVKIIVAAQAEQVHLLRRIADSNEALVQIAITQQMGAMGDNAILLTGVALDYSLLLQGETMPANSIPEGGSLDNGSAH
jgi:hypothetical protein